MSTDYTRQGTQHDHRHHRESFATRWGADLAAEAVEGAALALERVDYVHGGDGLAAGVLRVGDGVTDDVLEEDLEHAAGLLVDEPGDALDAAPPRQPTDRRLGDALDVVAQHLAVALGATLAKPLAALAAPRHRRKPRAALLLELGIRIRRKRKKRRNCVGGCCGFGVGTGKGIYRWAFGGNAKVLWSAEREVVLVDPGDGGVGALDRDRREGTRRGSVDTDR